MGALTVLNVAYPFAPVGANAVGGAEQVVGALDRCLAEAGYDCWVVACEGSSARGNLRTAPLPSSLDEVERARAREAYRRLVADTIAECRPALVHFHGVDFARYLPRCQVPSLVTLHLPLSFYSDADLVASPRLTLCCVSASQRATARGELRFGPDLQNGVDCGAFAPSAEHDDYLLVLSRIAPEKGVHIALELAHQLDLPLLLAGRVYAYEAHERYFSQQVAPLLDTRRRFIGAVGMPEKAALLARARCLIVPSLTAETSSLVSMEALASGTPVVAFDRGALAEVVRHGETGFLTRTRSEMCHALGRLGQISRAACRQAAEETFSETSMFERHVRLYHDLTRGSRSARSTRLRTELLTSQAELEGLGSDWCALWDAAPAASVFQRPEWLLSWTRHLLQGRPHVLGVWRGAQLLGLAPFFVWQKEDGPVLSCMGAGVSDYQDLIACAGEEAQVVGMIAEHLRSARGFRELLFSEVRPESLLARLCGRLGMPSSVAKQEPCPALALPASSAALHDAVPGKVWKYAQYASRRAHRSGLHIARVEPARFDASFDAFAALHTSRRAMRGEVPSFADARWACFQRSALSDLLSAEKLMLWLLLDDTGAALGGLLGFVDRDSFRLYLTGFSPTAAHFSPGTLLLAHALSWSIERGLRRFDFLRGAEPYKYRFGAKDALILERHHVRCP